MIPSYDRVLLPATLTILFFMTSCSHPPPSFSPIVVPSDQPSPSPIVSELPSITPVPEESDPHPWSGQAVDFIGEWHRTNEYIAYPATIQITNQTESGFDFSLEAYYQSHIGTTGGTAYYTSESTAFWRYDNSFDPIATGFLFFEMEDGNLKIDEAGQLPFGANVFACGLYITGEPTYLTNGVLERLGPERIALLEKTVGEDYELYVGAPLQYGYFEFADIQEDGYSGLLLEGFWPTFGYNQKIYIGDDGAVWINFYFDRHYTNRPNEEMPAFLLYEEPENS